jgi:hypothetical protein
MNHQPFETWLLSEETLPPEQALALREHLAACESCQRLEHSWSGVKLLIQRTAPAAPASGFKARWQDRLAKDRREHQQRQAWGMLAFTGSIAFALLLLLGYFSLDLVNSPEQLLMYAVYKLATLYFLGISSWEAFLGIMRSFTGVLPLALWAGMLGAISVLGVLWIVAYQKIMALRRVRV